MEMMNAEYFRILSLATLDTRKKSVFIYLSARTCLKFENLSFLLYGLDAISTIHGTTHYIIVVCLFKSIYNISIIMICCFFFVEISCTVASGMLPSCWLSIQYYNRIRSIFSFWFRIHFFYIWYCRHSTIVYDFTFEYEYVILLLFERGIAVRCECVWRCY